MNIAVIGAGALGSLMGFYLSGVTGHTVWLLDGWHEHIAAMQADGLSCERDGTVTRRPVNATTTPADIGPCDVLFVLVKAHQTTRAAEQARSLLHSTTLVITLQNGIGNRDLLATVLGPERVTQGVTMMGATLLGPGRVRHGGHGPTMFATTTGSRAVLADLVTLFQAAALSIELRDDVETLIWSKLIVNVGINALTALLRVPNGTLTTTPSAQTLLEHLIAEAVAVATARGTPIPGDPLQQVLAVATATSENHSSMLQDVLRGSPTEINTINGAIVREGERLGIPTPYNRVVTALMQALDDVAHPTH